MERVWDALKETAIILGITLLIVAVVVGIVALGIATNPVLAVIAFIVFFAGLIFAVEYFG